MPSDAEPDSSETMSAAGPCGPDSAQISERIRSITSVTFRGACSCDGDELQECPDFPTDSLRTPDDTSDERFQFTWYGKRTARLLAQSPTTATLRPCPAESVNWANTQNLFLEGDNLEVLKLLQRSFHKSVKLIYIDPPYNTGNDFIYADDFTDNLASYRQYTGQGSEAGDQDRNLEQSGRLHTRWLNMIYPRLLLSRNLLTDDGVIFLSIDENEQHHLRMLCDEVFGSENFVSNLIWQSRTSISNDREVSLNHNHTLIYARDRSQLSFFGDPIDESRYANPDNDPRGPWKLVPLDANKPGGNTHYPITNPTTGKQYYPPTGRIWAINPSEYQRLYDDDRIRFGLKGNAAPRRKLFLNERKSRGDTRTPSSLLLNAGTTRDGTEELMEIFDGEKVFDYPKPTTLIRRLLEYGCRRNEQNVVLDFFGGSGTTAHACLQHTSQPVRFISVHLPEPVDLRRPQGTAAAKMNLNTIAEIAKERLRRVIARMSADQHEADHGFRVYRLDSSNLSAISTVSENQPDTTASPAAGIKPNRSTPDIITEILLMLGYDPAAVIHSQMSGDHEFHTLDNRQLIICLSPHITDRFAVDLLSLQQGLSVPPPTVILNKQSIPNDSLGLSVLQQLQAAGISCVYSV